MIERAPIATMRRIEYHSRHTTNGVAVLERPKDDPTKAVFKQAFDAATTKFKPTPYKRPEQEELSGEEADGIIDTVTALGEDYTKRLVSMTDAQSAVFTQAYRKGLQELHSHNGHRENHHNGATASVIALPHIHPDHDHVHDHDTDHASVEAETSIPLHTSALIAYEDMYTAALKQAKGGGVFVMPNVGRHMTEDISDVITDAGERLGIRKMVEVEDLTDEQQAVFLSTYANLYNEFYNKDRQLTEQIHDLIEDKYISLEYINPDGTFQADRIQELPYFLDTREGRQEFREYDFSTRQLPADSPYRRKAKRQYDIDHVGHNHGPDEHHHEEQNDGACCSTHRKKELSMLRTQRKYSRYPRLATSISKVKELGWLALCPGDDFANLASNVIAPLFSGGDGEDHHHQEPNAYVPREPYAVVHKAKEEVNEKGQWETVDVETARIEDHKKIKEMLGEKNHEHGHDHRGEELHSGKHAPGEGKVSVAEIAERLKREAEGKEAAIIPFAPSRKRRRIAHTAAAVGVLAALGAGATGAGKFTSSAELSESSANASIVLQSPQSQPENRIRFDLPAQPERNMTSVSEPTTVFETVQRGDTQWGMIEEAVQEAGRTPDAGLVNVLTDLTAHTNQEATSNPDRLSVGQTLEMPNKEVISLVDAALDNPSSDPTLANDLQELNETEDMPKEEKIKKKDKLISKIKNYLKTKLQKVKMLLAS